MTNDVLITSIDAILPQTQCTQCSYPDCRSYASAIAEGLADINQCPPGDTAGIQKLAELLGVTPKPLNTTHGVPKPKAIALIDEMNCIGCTFCIKACPVDAIVGAAKQMHTVITAECTGCELCIAPCPVDCIQMIPVRFNPVRSDPDSRLADEFSQNAANLARTRHQFRSQRLEREKQEQTEKFAQKKDSKQSDDSKKAAIQAALKRAIEKKKRMTL